MLEGNHIQCFQCVVMLTASCHLRPRRDFPLALNKLQTGDHFRCQTFGLGVPTVYEITSQLLCVLEWQESGKQLVTLTARHTVKMTFPSTYQHNMKLDNIDLVKVSICCVSLKFVCWCPKPRYLWSMTITGDRRDSKLEITEVDWSNLTVVLIRQDWNTGMMLWRPRSETVI